jgi:anthranilate phosphoribosyltransferase
VAELKDGSVRRFSIQPEDFDIRRSALHSIRADGPEDSVKTIIGVLDNTAGPARDIVVLNAGAAIYVAGLAESLKEGIRKADRAIASGEARRRLDRLVVLTQSFE